MAKVAQPEQQDWESGLPLAAILDEYLASGGYHYVTARVGSSVPHGEKRTRGAFHASGGKCDRAALFKWDGKEGLPLDGRTYRVFAMGNLVEAFGESALKWKGVLEDSQVTVWRDWALRAGKGHRVMPSNRPGGQDWYDMHDCLIVGTLDFLIRWNPEWSKVRGPILPAMWASKGTKRHIVDCKSCNSGKFDWLGKEDRTYCLQQATYKDTFEEQYQKAVDDVRLWYMDKDTMRTQQVGIGMDKWGPLAREWWLKLREYAEARMNGGDWPDEVALGDDGYPAWQCDYCSYGKACDPATGEAFCPTIRAAYQLRVSKGKGGKEVTDIAADLKAGEAMGKKA